MRWLGQVGFCLFLMLATFANRALADPFQIGQDAFDRRDYQVAMVVWMPLARAGNGCAAHGVARIYQGGYGVERDYASALEWAHKAIAEGCVDANNILGVAYSTGRGLPRDVKQAEKYFTIAAEHGLARAQVNLADLYSCGCGIRIDLRAAVGLLQGAVDQGYARAEFDLGHNYFYGWGVPIDPVKAIKLFTLAADQGLPTAQHELGVRYLAGTGVPIDLVQAHKWLTLAAANPESELWEMQVVTVKDRNRAALMLSKEQLAQSAQLITDWKPTPALFKY